MIYGCFWMSSVLWTHLSSRLRVRCREQNSRRTPGLRTRRSSGNSREEPLSWSCLNCPTFSQINCYYHWKLSAQSTYFTVRGQSHFSRLPKYWPPPSPSPPGECVPPAFVAGGRTDSPGGEGEGGSIFWKTREIGLPSYNKICPLWLSGFLTFNPCAILIANIDRSVLHLINKKLSFSHLHLLPQVRKL